MSVFWRPRGCVLWFDFATLSGSIAHDLSRQKNNGTIYGAIWKRGYLVGALSFDGVDDYVEVPHDPSLKPTSELTVEAYARSKAPLWNDYGFLVSTREETRGYILHPDKDSKLLRFYIADGTTWYNVSWDIPNITVWNHFVGVYDGSKLQIWGNGVLRGSIDLVITLNGGTNPIHIGHDYDDPIRYGYCDIALVRIYNRALTEREIKAHYHYLTKPMARVPA